jgi:thimet oligopeptidase
MTNPFFKDLNKIVDFQSVTVQNVVDATEKSICKAKPKLNVIFAINNVDKSFENTMRTLDDIFNDLMKVNEVISLLAYVHPNDDIRNKCLESIADFSKFFNEISLNEDLYKAIKEYESTKEANVLVGAKRLRNLNVMVSHYQKISEIS